MAFNAAMRVNARVWGGTSRGPQPRIKSEPAHAAGQQINPAALVGEGSIMITAGVRESVSVQETGAAGGSACESVAVCVRGGGGGGG